MARMLELVAGAIEEAGRRHTHLPGDGRGDAPGEDGSRSLPLTLLY